MQCVCRKTRAEMVSLWYMAYKPQVKEQKTFDHEAFEEAMRQRHVQPSGFGAAPSDYAAFDLGQSAPPPHTGFGAYGTGLAVAAMPKSDAKQLPQRTDAKSFDHAAFEAARPAQRGYDLRKLDASLPPPVADGFQPFDCSGFGCPLNAADSFAGFDAYGAGYSDLQKAYCPDMQHYTTAQPERTLDQLLAERARGGRVDPDAEVELEPQNPRSDEPEKTHKKAGRRKATSGSGGGSTRSAR